MAASCAVRKLPVRGICAHQGDIQFFPGNTVEAIRSAVRKGADMVEFDVQRCKTGEFVLMHDATIDKLTTGKGRICDHTLEELKSYTYRRFPEKACRIATLDEALDVIPDSGILINVHCYAGRKAIGDIARHLRARGRLHQSFICSYLKDIDAARKAVGKLLPLTEDLVRKVLPKPAAALKPVSGGTFPSYVAKDAAGATVGYAVVGTGEGVGPHGKIVLHVLFGFTAAKAPAIRPQINLNQPDIPMTDMEVAQRTALAQALTSATARVRALAD